MKKTPTHEWMRTARSSRGGQIPGMFAGGCAQSPRRRRRGTSNQSRTTLPRDEPQPIGGGGGVSGEIQTWFRTGVGVALFASSAWPPEVSAAVQGMRSGCHQREASGRPGRRQVALGAPGPGERERGAAGRPAGPGAGSGKQGPEVGGTRRAGSAAHLSAPASAGWGLGGGGGLLAAPRPPWRRISVVTLSFCVVENR